MICVNCGYDNPPATHYCDNCGVELGRSTTPDTHPDEVVDDPDAAGGTSFSQRSQAPDPDQDETGS
ncbi:MAG: hypothetical protein KY462_06860 [Actinobacteria bacterium]|nr:hypothetical protein [Actinomycetota bacterium]